MYQKYALFFFLFRLKLRNKNVKFIFQCEGKTWIRISQELGKGWHYTISTERRTRAFSPGATLGKLELSLRVCENPGGLHTRIHTQPISAISNPKLITFRNRRKTVLKKAQNSRFTDGKPKNVSYLHIKNELQQKNLRFAPTKKIIVSNVINNLGCLPLYLPGPSLSNHFNSKVTIFCNNVNYLEKFFTWEKF